MRAKRYFWNTEKHRRLDEAMGLGRRMPEPLARLAEACGLSPNIEGTKALMPVSLFNNLERVVPEKMRGMVEYDFSGAGAPHKFYRMGVHRN